MRISELSLVRFDRLRNQAQSHLSVVIEGQTFDVNVLHTEIELLNTNRDLLAHITLRNMKQKVMREIEKTLFQGLA